MKTLVLCYSLGGNTRGVAHELATLLDADEAEITCARYRPGVIGFVRAGFDSVRRARPPIALDPEVALAEYDQIVLGSPVWVGSISAPVRAALSALQDWPRNVALLMTSGGQDALDKSVAETEAALGVQLRGVCNLSAAELKSDDRAARLAEFRDQIATAPA